MCLNTLSYEDAFCMSYSSGAKGKKLKAKEFSDTDSDDNRQYKRREVEDFMNDISPQGPGDRLRRWTVKVMLGLRAGDEFVNAKTSARILAQGVDKPPTILFREPVTFADGLEANSGLEVGVVIVHSDRTTTVIDSLSQVKFRRLRPGLRLPPPDEDTDDVHDVDVLWDVAHTHLK